MRLAALLALAFAAGFLACWALVDWLFGGRARPATADEEILVPQYDFIEKHDAARGGRA